MKINGVYAWEVNGIVRYVGSGHNITDSRKSNHLANLRHGKHSNRALQEAFDKFGEDAFKFVVLEECAVRDLYTREKYYMDQYQDTIFNVVGINNTKKQKRTGKKAVSHKTKFKDMFSNVNNPNCQTKLETIIAIKRDIAAGLSNREIGIKYGKSSAYISRIRVGDRWNSITIDNIFTGNVPIDSLFVGNINTNVGGM